MATNLTCPDTYPAVPSGIKMVVNSSEAQPLIMCPGQRVRYWCDAGGINVREVGAEIKILNNVIKLFP